MTTLSRRQVLCGAGAVCATGALAACSSGGGGGGAAAPAPSPGGALVALADVPVGEVVAATTPGGDPVLVVRRSETEVAAFSAVCTHQGCTVEPSGACPCHGSRFDPKTGEVVSGPAEQPLPALAVTVVDGQVLTA